MSRHSAPNLTCRGSYGIESLDKELSRIVRDAELGKQLAVPSLAMNNHPNPPALLLIGHGSRDAGGVREFQRMAERLFAALPGRLCLSSFLELTEPSLREGVVQLSRQGATAITALPVMLMAAGHIKNDIPAELEIIQAECPDLSITLGTELGIHPALLQAARERIEAGEAAFGPDYSRRDALLLVAGRGSSDPDANSNLAQITRWLWEMLGFGWAETAYCAVTPPSVAVALERVHHLNFKYRLVFPYVLFSGRVIRQITDAVDSYRRLQPKIQVAMAPYLNDHPLVAQTLIERLHQAEAGQAVMNCPLCQYKEAIIGYEHRRGMPRTGQHHHDT